jgi:glutamine synthetase
LFDLDLTTSTTFLFDKPNNCNSAASSSIMAIGDDPSELTHSDLPELLKNDTSVKVGGTDIDGQIRGKLMSKKKFLSIAKSGFGFCSVIFGWDMHDQTYYKELKISNAQNGYRDIVAQVDLASFRRIPWENNMPFFMCSFLEPEGESLSACPRSLLARAVAKIEKKGYGALAGGKFVISSLVVLMHYARSTACPQCVDSTSR